MDEVRCLGKGKDKMRREKRRTIKGNGRMVPSERFFVLHSWKRKIKEWRTEGVGKKRRKK